MYKKCIPGSKDLVLKDNIKNIISIFNAGYMLK